MLRAACAVLVDEPDGLPAGEVIRRVKELEPPSESEATINASGSVRYDTNLRFWSVGLVKAEWVHKQKGRWYLTGRGREALERYPDPSVFERELDKLYREWKKRTEAEKESREVWKTTDAVVSRVPPGRWVSFGDLSDVVRRGESQLGKHMWVDVPLGWHRILSQRGVPSADSYGSEDRADEQRRLLLDEGVVADPAAPQERRLSVDELQSIVAEVTGAPRAWVVRGSSVRGVDVVPRWLEDGFVSLPASRLTTSPVGVDDTELKTAVEASYDSLGYSARQAKLEEIRAFVRRVKPGNLLLATSGAEVYVGEVVGDVTWSPTEDGLANLRRAVVWDNADSPLDVSDLPEQLLGKLRSSSDVVDLTDVYAAVAGLRVTDVAVDEEPRLPTGPLLPDRLDEAVADRLLVGRGWLDEFVHLLAERRQVILYGPPGTGKTFLAQEVAEALTSPERVRLVQFHPAYSYEDFFEGYRPASGADGQVGFRLVPGPFRKIVDAAREDRDHAYVLIIDEINRANLAKVFGELYFLLEYRDRTIDLLYSSDSETGGFSLPENVFLIGTMNTADRSIALVDAAMRRRFAFLSLHPDDEHLRGVLTAWLRERDLSAEPALVLAELNARIPDKDFKIGPSYLMRDSAATDEGLARIWRTSIVPLLEEFHVGDGIDVEKRYGLDSLRRAVGAAAVDVAVPEELSLAAESDEPLP